MLFKPFIAILISLLTSKVAMCQSSINDLTADKSGWDFVKSITSTAKNKVVILPTEQISAANALTKVQATTRSPMGAIIYFTGGLLIDNGWIRILGSGNEKLPRTLPGWNKGKTFKNDGEKPNHLLIADDAIGGFFAVNGGDLGAAMGIVYYLAPETLQWESLDLGYSDFLNFCLNGDLNKFYKNFRWKNWKKESAELNGDQVFSFYPFLWSKEGRNINRSKRSVVPIEEYYVVTMDAIKTIRP